MLTFSNGIFFFGGGGLIRSNHVTLLLFTSYIEDLKSYIEGRKSFEFCFSLNLLLSQKSHTLVLGFRAAYANFKYVYQRQLSRYPGEFTKQNS